MKLKTIMKKAKNQRRLFRTVKTISIISLIYNLALLSALTIICIAKPNAVTPLQMLLVDAHIITATGSICGMNWAIKESKKREETIKS